MEQIALDLRSQGERDALRLALRELGEARQGIERLKRYLAVCHRDIDTLERENERLRATSREASFHKARVKMLEDNATSDA
jgi:hypothetical protein